MHTAKAGEAPKKPTPRIIAPSARNARLMFMSFPFGKLVWFPLFHSDKAEPAKREQRSCSYFAVFCFLFVQWAGRLLGL